MSRQLWRPATDSEGLPYEMLNSFTIALTEWRDQFLTLVGVPSNFEGEWDFVSVSIPHLTTLLQKRNLRPLLRPGRLVMRERRDLPCHVDHPVQRFGRLWSKGTE